jgi:hypothetical protein
LEKRAYIAEITNLILAASETEKNIKHHINNLINILFLSNRQ